jgi:hypothetical protein
MVTATQVKEGKRDRPLKYPRADLRSEREGASGDPLGSGEAKAKERKHERRRKKKKGEKGKISQRGIKIRDKGKGERGMKRGERGK